MDHLPAKEQATDRNTVRAVERALDILLCFGTDRDLGLTEISSRVSLHKSTVHRLLASLEAKGFVERHQQSDRYRLGWGVLELASQMFQSDDLVSRVLPEMTALRDSIGETISLYVRSGIERIRIQAIEGVHPVRRVANIGKRFPLYVGASGKVLLAFSSDNVLEELRTLGAFPEELDISELKLQCDHIRQVGYAVSIEEREVGAAAVAAPIFDRQHKCIAALSVSGPVDRYTPSEVIHFAKSCMDTSEAISRYLGL
ncbi:MAG: IclR family transcriptional regulator [Acidibacillus sp.]|uniref:Glycerol operon regulatory protein n=1 Tax=Sulfoacidibacillus ferrooxidans TaxID=2005001 RepID=A0A9X1V749_9BACL|nr:IclR family transcriptional regulator [Sulfoacidibacillus ferrooxidans]MCI0182493.1 Pectin degradation repressor protein KdgR [Sulfoacidibacillus ferrooxidans]MCY0894233.1 IclR family transcriptional regulator [Acidibacillus sp.]